MNITDLKASLPYLMKAQVATLIHGHRGVGKSQTVRDFCVENEYHYVDIRLGNMADTGDLIGLPEIVRNAEGHGESFTFMPPQWLKDVKEFAETNPDKQAVIFLDELNRARRDILQAIFQLVLDKRLNTYQLPDNVAVIAAVNPETDDYIVTDLADSALKDRFCHVKLTPTNEEWYSYATDKGFARDIVNYLREQPDMLEPQLTEFSLDVKPSRRSWETFNRIVGLKPPADLLREMGYGLLGAEAVEAYRSYSANQEKPLEAYDIIDNYKGEHRKTLRRWIKEDKMDLINATCDNFVTENTRYDREVYKEWNKDTQAPHIIQFLLDLPAEFMFLTCQRVFITVPCFMMIQTCKKIVKRLEEIKSINPAVGKGFKAEEVEQAKA